MNILIVGSGGREHALAWKILQSPHVKHLYMTATNTSATTLSKQYPGKLIHTAGIPEKDSVAIVEFAKQNKTQLVVIGSEAPLADGLADALTAAQINAFGPSKKAAQIESSKAFAKKFMQKYKIPTARYATFTELNAARDYISKLNYPFVIKASGLAAGKGVFLPNDIQEAEKILQNLMVEFSLGHAGKEIVIEERLQGEEVSLLAFADGAVVKAMPAAADFKRLRDQDQGPNTGGMGAYAPVNLSAEKIAELTETILQPAIDGMRAEGTPFVGVLYAGLMMTADGPRVIEFNCRFGDPETQVLLPLLESDLVEIMEACIQTKLSHCDIRWNNKSSVCVVLATEHYPEKSSTGELISGLNKNHTNPVVFHAGTRWLDGQIATSGGRVLGVTAWGENIALARDLAYQAAAEIKFSGMQYRKDIAANVGSSDLYAASGVDIYAGNKAVKLMSEAVKSTYGAEVLAGIGAFGGMFDASSFKKMQAPVLVASTDGVGTKVEVGIRANKLQNLGHDIVNHSVNDILVQGAKPLFFLDYIASSKLDPEKVALVVSGMADACRAVNCALLGGETAEMPGVYLPEAFDVAGTIIGIVERRQALPQTKRLQVGDKLVGIASSGPHTNGYSLIRKVFADVSLDTVFPELGIPLSDALLAPHRCYLPILQPILQREDAPIKALIHITGGGFYENIPRVLPNHLTARINPKSWQVPALFQLIQKRGAVPDEQMYRVYNMGIGMVMVCAPEQVELLQNSIREKTWVIGELIQGNHEITLEF